MSKTVLGGSVNGRSIMNYNDREGRYLQSDREPERYITRYVKVIRTFTPIFSSLYAHFGTFSNISLVFVVITSWFTADL